MRADGRGVLWGAVAVALAAAAALVWVDGRSRDEALEPPTMPATTVLASTTAAPSATASASATVSAAPSSGPPEPSLPSWARLHPETERRCPAGMAYVTGVYCPYVAHRCDSHLGAPGADDGGYVLSGRRVRSPRRCATFRDLSICGGKPLRLSFCIDRHEYPNQPGPKPAVMASYHDAKRLCEAEGKRICEAEEWIFACEGLRSWPYPTGRTRPSNACHLDRVPRRPNSDAMGTPFEVAGEVSRLEQRRPIGAQADCASPFGVFDMSGNVAEWVHDREGKKHVAPRVTALAGGDWERTPGTCRYLDGDHGASHRSHTTGFRCCADARGMPPRQKMPDGYKLPTRRALGAPTP